MTREELAYYDGREGRKAYIAVNDTIYDVTTSPLWADGDHQGSHQAGEDLTDELQTAPHVRAVIERFPVVGKLTASAPPAAAAGGSAKVIIGLVAAVILGVLLLVLLR